MKIDTNTIVLKPVATEVADGGEKGQNFQKTAKQQAQPVAPDALDIVELGEIDVVTISKGIRPVGESAPSAAFTPAPQTVPEAAPTPSDSDVKNFKKADAKDKTSKGSVPSNIAVSKTDIEDVDTVRISREIKSALKTILLNDTGTARRIDINHEAGVGAFLLPFLSEVIPGWEVRLKKVYRKKSGPLLKKKKKTKDGDGQGPPEQETSPGDYNDYRAGYYDEAGSLKLLGGGLITTQDDYRLRFSLEFDIKAEDGLALRGDKLKLPPIEINYSGPADRLEDYRFSFEAEHRDVDGSFKGRGYGLFIIDLAEVGTAEDGSVIYGIGAQERSTVANGLWTEISPDQAEG